MKVLCYVNHFFGQNPFFEGKSSLPVGSNLKLVEAAAKRRKQYVELVISQLKKIEGIEVKVCGIAGFSLVPIDIHFNHIKEKPLHLIYESLNHMVEFIDEYDYFINIEDDILLPQATFDNVLSFDKISLVNELFLPNRIEQSPNGEEYCVDIKAIPGWTQQRKMFQAKTLQVAQNPHSAILIMSREKMKYALTFIDRDFRGKILYNELDSSFAYYHSPFSLFRSTDLSFHQVLHLDKWLYSAGESKSENVWSYRLRSVQIIDFIPPIFVRIFSFIKKKHS